MNINGYENGFIGTREFDDTMMVWAREGDRKMSDESDHPYFGGCPICHDCGGYINVGRSHWFFCDEHKVRWNVGSNLFSSWRDQTEEEQRAVYNAKDFGSYKVVEPHHEAVPAAENTPPKQYGTNTHRDVAKERLIQTIYESIGGGPWTDDFEEALADFLAKFNSAIDAVPYVAEVFDKPLSQPNHTDVDLSWM
jgi:hypothetical protein